ncbi:MAG: hypothetical protein AB7L28_07700 [Kofleriaceae bacterium]
MLLLAVAACTGAAESDATRPDANVFEVEPGLFVSLDPIGKADLPNSGLSPRMLDTIGYRAIADIFAATNFDLAPTGASAAYDWPLRGSLSVLNRQGTPIRLMSDVYEHTGLDIIRQTDFEDDTVHAPVSGTALVTDWYGQQEFPRGDYSTVISIWDPDTHLIVQLMHVKPDVSFPQNEYFPVTRGQPIGKLAKLEVPGGSHTHVNVIDGQQFELIDPVTAFPAYPDSAGPVTSDFYLLDELAGKWLLLRDGPMDLVVTAHDRDDMSPRNLEVTSIAYTATDQAGNVLGGIERCQLSDAYKVLATDGSTSASTIRLIDFGNAGDNLRGFWPGSDMGDPDRLFRYAVTNLRMVDGQCSIVAEDRDGQLMITPEVTELTVVFDVWDARGNQTTTTVMLSRTANPVVID